MFEQSILVQKRTTKPWSVLLSLAVELAGIGLLIVAPLIWADRMPTLSLTRIAVWMPLMHTSAPVHPMPAAGPHSKPSPFAQGKIFVAPITMPDHPIAFNDPPPQETGYEAFASGPENRIGFFGPANTPGPPERLVKRTADPSPTAPTTRIRVSRVEPAKILYKVLPVYPPLARATHVSGTVYLLGVISTDGSIQSLKVLRGHPLLINAALDAVRQWRYQPTILNGQAVEVEAPIDITFVLQ